MMHLTPENIDALYTTYHAALERYLWRLVGDRELAADLAQETFAKALGTAQMDHRVVSLVTPRAWLYRIATNCAIDELRRGKVITWTTFSDLEQATGNAASETFADGSVEAQFSERIAQRDAIAGVLAQLTLAERRCLLLVQYHSPAVCAHHLGISLSAYKMRLSRARRRFVTLWRQDVSVA